MGSRGREGVGVIRGTWKVDKEIHLLIHFLFFPCFFFNFNLRGYTFPNIFGKAGIEWLMLHDMTFQRAWIVGNLYMIQS